MDEVLYSEGVGGRSIVRIFPFYHWFPWDVTGLPSGKKNSSDVLIYIHLDYTDLWVDVLDSTNLFRGLQQI